MTPTFWLTFNVKTSLIDIEIKCVNDLTYTTQNIWEKYKRDRKYPKEKEPDVKRYRKNIFSNFII